MKAIRTGSPAALDTLEVFEMDDPGEPGRGEIRVDLKASSINFHDYAVVTGKIPTDGHRIPLSDGAGEVVAVGDGVSDFAVGDRVVSTFFTKWQSGPSPDKPGFADVPGDGIDGHAREAVVRPANCFTFAPRNLSHVEAATLTCAGVTAWRALFVDDDVKPGDTVLVLGTGGVSIFALQLAKAAGARVIATSSSDDKLERLRALGADETINYEDLPQWGKRVSELTDGRGVDVTVEIGGPGTLDQSIDATRMGGHIALIGVLTGQSGEVATAKMMGRNQRLQGLTVGSRTHQMELVRAIEANGIKPQVSDTFALEDLADAFRREESGEHFGKIAIEIG
ncbi:zinc-binding dehydrogenase [Erythrobacter sp. 3-20A1M]|uniref:zinc-dependent alcohol dehydrogenase family protein n=1 Tax=Erythrobacter sp. 3-20A1M TaxID=2653850 RepID=UPI001BFC06BF|nr:NAD(P)-dependent alcohol dehydrogenase [Erythrobacter sp. 3-20A1M]QWC55808.1 zinc-binding dehydrogenase [Erythrobacter sp. 3-20A1M]